jgi:hypothetical protein
MADEQLNEVQPGDLITARLINAIIRLLKDLELKLGGPVTVPNLYGETLGNARTVLTTGTPPLGLGPVLLDSNGLSVNPTHPDNQFRRVIGQVPPAGARVVGNSLVSLLIAGEPSSTTPTNGPEITGFLPGSIPMGEEVQILGKNFASQPGNNLVRFNGVPITGTPSVRSTTFSLYVIVPTGIPNVPTTPGATPVNVTVTVVNQTTGKQVESTTLKVGPSTGIVKPVITGVSPTNPRVNTQIVITGTGFTSDASPVRVFFGDEPTGGVAPTQSSATSLTLTVPTNLSGTGSVDKQFVVRVQVNGPSGPKSDENTQSVITVRPPLVL